MIIKWNSWNSQNEMNEIREIRKMCLLFKVNLLSENVE